MGHDDREQNFEQALTRHLRGAGGDRTTNDYVTGCPDAQMLAAFHERMLTSEEMDATKEHVVGCARCQEILALLETTDDIEVRNEQEKVLAMSSPMLVSSAGSNVEASAHAHIATRPADRAKEPQHTSRVRRGTWRWIAPAGAIAASLLLWVVARENTFRHAEFNKTVQIAQDQAANKLSPAPAPPPSGELPTDQLRPNVSASTQTEQALRVRPSARRAPEGVPQPPGDAVAGNARAGNVAGRPAGTAGGPATERNNSEHAEPGSAAQSSQPQRPEGPARGQLQTTESANTAANAPANLANDGDRKKTHSVAAANDAAKIADSTQAKANSAVTANPDSGRNVESKVSSQRPAESASGAQVAAVQQTDAPASKPASSAADESRDAAHKRSDRSNQDALSVQSESAEIGSRFKRDPTVTNVASKNARIVSVPGGKVEWRLGAPWTIERSVDGGLTWTRQKTGTSAELLAGAAPTEVVCWVVGRNGTILRTTDGGGHWSKVVSPVAEDIGAIAADDAMHAVVTGTGAIPARFATNDGGATWFQTNK